MRYLLILFISFSICFTPSLGQRIDSLRRLTKQLNSIKKIDALNELAYATGTLNTGESKTSALKAYDLSTKLNYPKGQATALLNFAFSEYASGHMYRSDSLLKKSIALNHSIKEEFNEGYGLACLASNFLDKGLPDSAKLYYTKSFQLLKSGGHQYYLSYLYATISDYYQQKLQPDSQLYYIKQAWEIRKKIPDKFYLVFTGTRLAQYYIKVHDYTSALAYLDSSQWSIGKDTIESEGLNIIRTSRAIIYTRLGNYKLASFLFDKAKKYYSERLFPEELVKLLLEKTELYEEMGNYEVSIKDALEALSISELNHFQLLGTRSLLRVARTYFDLKQFSLSERYIKDAIRAAENLGQTAELAIAYDLYGQLLIKIDSEGSEFYFRKALAIRLMSHDIIGQAEEYFSLGQLASKKGRFDSALYFHLRSLKVLSPINPPLGMSYVLTYVGKSYAQLNDFRRAKLYLDRAEKLADSIKSGTVLLDVFKEKRELAELEQDWNRYRLYTKRYESLSDSLLNSSLFNRISAIENRYEAQKKNDEIELQRTRLLANELELKSSREKVLFLSIGTIVIFTMSLLILYGYQSTKRLNVTIVDQNRHLEGSKEVIQAQNNDLVSTNEKILAQQMVIESQKESIEKQNIKLKTIVKKRTRELVEYIHQLEQFTFITSHNLRAPVARILGLGNLLETTGIVASDSQTIHKALINTTRELDRVISDLNLILEIRSKNDIELVPVDLGEVLQTIRISLQNEITTNHALILENFDSVKKVKSFRPYLLSILTNLISNSIKYRRPELTPVINVLTIEKKKSICIKVSDNGLGIDLKSHGDKIFTLYKRFHAHVEGKGLGLYMVKTQLATLGGKIKVKSKLNQGTTFYIFLKKQKVLDDRLVEGAQHQEN